MARLALNLEHDTSIVYEKDGKLKIIEVERYFKEKHYNSSYKPLVFEGDYESFIPKEMQEKYFYRGSNHSFNNFYALFNFIKKLDLDKDSITEINISCCLDKDLFKTARALLKNIFKNASQINSINHRICHAHSVYGTTDLNDAISVVSDGGGNGNFTIIHHSLNRSEIIYNEDQNFGAFYDQVARRILARLGPLPASGWEGSFMGFSSYGELDLPLFYKLSNIISSFEKRSFDRILEIDSILESYSSTENFALTFQKAWVNSFLQLLSRFKDPSKGVCLSGGCFLNCELNRKILDSGFFKSVHFTPLASDCGQALGAYLLDKKVEFKTYHGGPLYDKDFFDKNKDSFKVEELDLKKLAQLLFDNKIVGYISGDMEVGPRALGNRSIFANPLNPDMRQILNDRVKHRQWYRPYGAIMERGVLPLYFDLDEDLPYMNVLVYNKTKHFPAITHVDNSTRVQTITEKQNSKVSNLLSEFGKISGFPVLINTSFNVRGQPIINWCEDALNMLKKSELDYIVIEDFLVSIK